MDNYTVFVAYDEEHDVFSEVFVKNLSLVKFISI